MSGPLLRLSSEGALEAEFDTSGSLVNIYGVRPNGGIAMMRLDGAIKVVDNFGVDGKRKSAVRLESPPIVFFPAQNCSIWDGRDPGSRAAVSRGI
jgi:hypothetical protein